MTFIVMYTACVYRDCCNVFSSLFQIVYEMMIELIMGYINIIWISHTILP